MKKCFLMFVFFVVMLLIAALTDRADAMISENNAVEYADAEVFLADDQLSKE